MNTAPQALNPPVHWPHAATMPLEHAPEIDSHALAQTIEAPSLEEQVARLQALLEASRQVHATIDAAAVLQSTCRLLVRELEVEAAFCLTPGTSRRLAGQGASVPPPYAGCHRFPLIARDGTPLADLLILTGDSGTEDAPTLSLYERDFIEGLVLQAAVALENAVLHERDLQWARLQQDLDAARSIQRSLLPKTMPEIPNFSVAARMVTCYEVGGDYLDAIPLSDGSHLLIVADVAGKGLASAIVATSFRAAFRSLATQPLSLLDLVTRIGQRHWDEGSEARRRYVTAIVVRLDPLYHRVEVVNAGHNPGTLLLPDGTLRSLNASGTPLGLLPSATYTTETFDFPPGSRLLLYTDGLTEVFCGEEEFGCHRLTEAFRDTAPQAAEATLQSLWDHLDAFAAASLQPEHQTDDMTALAICHAPSPTLLSEVRP